MEKIPSGFKPGESESPYSLSWSTEFKWYPRIRNLTACTETSDNRLSDIIDPSTTKSFCMYDEILTDHSPWCKRIYVFHLVGINLKITAKDNNMHGWFSSGGNEQPCIHQEKC